MKARLVREVGGGFGGTTQETCVVEVVDGEPLPEGAVGLVSDDTPLSDWTSFAPTPATIDRKAPEEEPECRRIL